MRVLISAVLGLLLTLSCVAPVFAAQAPTFPSCSSPNGTQIANYPDGTHGIAGSTDTHTGSDAVYRVGSSTVVQCYCPENGSGVQTNWWNVSGLSGEDIEIFKHDGWLFFPNGSVWGLDDAPYLAKNVSYQCKEQTESSSASSSNSGSSSDSNSNSSSGSVLGAQIGGSVLGLADTGGIWQSYLILMTGIFCVAASIVLKRKQKTQ